MANTLTIENQLQQKSANYYGLYLKLKQWATSQWEHNDVPEQIRHDVSHSEALMEYANTILKNKLKANFLDAKELFLFASAVYLHDIGMQFGWKEHLEIQGDRGNLSSEERKQIRLNHAKTSGQVICSFTSDLPRSLADNLSPKEIKLLNDLNERIAFIAQAHNRSGIATYLKQIPALFPDNSLKIDFLAALLQFCDTMHMDKSRLNESRFLDELGKWEAGKPLEAAYEPKDWQRFFQSYFVGLVSLVSVVDESDVFEIQVDIQFNPQENETYRNRFLSIYRRRLERRKHDCLEVLRDHGIRFTGDDPFNLLEPESTIILLPQCFVDLFSQLEADAKTAVITTPSEKSQPNSTTSRLLVDYHSWRCATTATYVIPGINNTPIPIGKCWLPLSTIELPLDNPPPQSPYEELDLYMKTGKEKTGRQSKYDAEWMGVGLRRVVIVGGPGSGKSLLLQRITHRESEAGNTVILAKLKYVASEMSSKNLLFDEALTTVALAGFNCNDPEKKAIFHSATLLLLDGLDECGGKRQAIAGEIVKWSASHPQTTIIIATRPVGHKPATLPQWPHYALTIESTYAHRFSEFALDGVCKEVFKDRQDLIDQIEKRLHRVIHSDGWREKDSDYKAIKNVPLLFSFVISLAVNGCDIPDQRMALYRDVIKLLANDDVQDRGTETMVGASEADLFLHHLAWLLMENPVLEYDAIIVKSGCVLTTEFGLKGAAAKQLAERAFRFWEERRLLEQLHHGAGSLIAFMHLGFCEYAAAKYLETLSPEEIKRWVATTRRDTRWKEVYLNAASLGLGQTIIEALLELDHPVPPDSNEALFAAELAAIAETVNETILQRLLQHIMQRITSAYPSQVCEAAESLLPLARKYPQLVGPQYRPLLEHDEEWTRYSALALCIEAGKEFVDIQKMRESYPNLVPASRIPSSTYPRNDLMSLREPYKLKSSVIIGSTKMLLGEGVTPDLLERIKQIQHKNLSMYEVSELSSVLNESGDPDVVAITKKHEEELWGDFILPDIAQHDIYVSGFLDLILEVCIATKDFIPAEGSKTYINLGKIQQILNLNQAGMSDFIAISRFKNKKRETQLVLHGAIQAAGIITSELASEIIEINTECENGPQSYFQAMGQVPEFPMAGDWSKCSEICNKEPDLLSLALAHPSSVIALSSAKIIASSAINDPLKASLAKALNQYSSDTLYYISQLAEHIWGENTLEVVLSRLEKELTSGCKHLIDKFPVYSSGQCNDRILGVIKRALLAESEDVAEAAADLCLEFVSNELFLSEMKGALSYWKDHEKPYPIPRGVIPPSPRPTLMKAIIQRNGFSFDELVELYEDVRSDVKELAKKSLLQSAEESPDVTSSKLNLVESGRFGSDMLRSLLQLPQMSLQHERQRLINLFNSDNPDIQIAMFAALKRHDLFSETEAIKLLRQKLNSPNVAIREAANHALRQYGPKLPSDSTEKEALPPCP